MGSPQPIGIIADDPLQRHVLQHAISIYGYRVAANYDPGRLDPQLIEQAEAAQAWVVDLSDEERWSDALDQLLELTEAPILFGLGKAPGRNSIDYPRWERRLFTKLRELVGDPIDLSEHGESLGQLEAAEQQSRQVPLPSGMTPYSNQAPVERVVILGASLGGPAAVKAFLDCLPQGLPVAFVYAQHIDANFAGVLAKVLGRHSCFTLVEAAQGAPLRYGEVLIVPVERELVLDEQGRIQLKDTPWPGPYGPSIDQVMLNISSYYGARCHTILFSGMGNDGAIAAPVIQAYGSRIWVQESSSCANSSMPDSVAATGCTSFSGTPEELASKLVKTIELEEIEKRRQQRA